MMALRIAHGAMVPLLAFNGTERFALRVGEIATPFGQRPAQVYFRL